MFCSKCGTSINDDAVVCPKCGVAVANGKVPNAGPAPLILGIASFVTWLIPLIGLPVSVVGIVLSAKRNRNVCLALNIIGVVLSILNAIVGAVLGAQGKLF